MSKPIQSSVKLLSVSNTAVVSID